MFKSEILIFLSSIFLLLSSCTDDNPDSGKPRCGDFMINQFSEECDNADFGSKSCNSMGYYGGYLMCTSQCKIDTSSCETFGRCGDGVLNVFEGEECDTDNSNGKTCESLGYYGGTIKCDSNCKLDLSDCIDAGYCGDSIVQMEESCDGTDYLDGKDSCEALGYYGGTLSCAKDCTLNLKDCEANGRCGDGLIQSGAGEVCDTNSLDGANCGTYDYWTGNLRCLDDCSLDFSECTTMTQVSVGAFHTCAIDSNFVAWCWGNGTYGALGDGYMDLSDDPVEHYATSPVHVLVPPGIIFDKIETGAIFTCALDTTGTAWCWGLGLYGELGAGDSVLAASTPNRIQMPDGVTFTDLSVGTYHTCAVGDNGKVYCWGLGNLGQLGIFHSAEMPNSIHNPTDGLYYSRTPQPILEDNISPDEHFVKVNVGTYHSCALTDTKNLYCWGIDDSCEITDTEQYSCAYFTPYNDDSPSYSKKCDPVPALTISGANIELFALGGGSFGEQENNTEIVYGHTCIYANNSVYCRGSNLKGQLGSTNVELNDYHHCTFERVTLPLGVTNVDSLTAGLAHTCIAGQGVAWCWGFNYVGQIGIGTTSYSEPIPRLVTKPFGKTFHDISAGLMTTCTLGSGTVWCWGLGIQGQLGIGTTDALNEPHPIAPPAN